MANASKSQDKDPQRPPQSQAAPGRESEPPRHRGSDRLKDRGARITGGERLVEREGRRCLTLRLGR